MSSMDSIRSSVRPHLAAVQRYAGIEPTEEMARTLGLPPELLLKLDGNENPYGCSPLVQRTLGEYESYNQYPDPEQRAVRRALAQYVGIGMDHIVAGAGADELIDLIIRVFLEPGDGVVDCSPTFGMYSFSSAVHGCRLIPAPRDGQLHVDVDGVIQAAQNQAKVVFIASPNNPTGDTTSQEDLLRILDTGLLVVIDETYYEFCGQTMVELIGKYPNLIILRSMSKWAGLASLRIGYAIMIPDIAEVMLAVKSPYNVSGAAEVALLASLNDKDYLMANVQKIVLERDRMLVSLELMAGIQPLPSRGNFLLCRVTQGDGEEVWQKLARQGVLVRYFDTPRLRDHIRFSVGLPRDTDRLLSALESVL